MTISVRVAYPEQVNELYEDRLKPFIVLGAVEVAFLSPEFFIKNVVVNNVISAVEKFSLKVSSIHLPHVNLNIPQDSKLVFEKSFLLAKGLKTRHLIIHPSKGDSSSVRKRIEKEITPQLENQDVYLCWETFESKKRLFGGIEGLFNFSKKQKRHKICFDFSHVHVGQYKLLELLKQYKQEIAVFHVSNRMTQENKIIQHLPMWEHTFPEGKADLDFEPIIKLLKQSNPKVDFVLEYLFDYHKFLLRDALKLKFF